MTDATPLAQQLAAYAANLSYDDLDDETIQRVKDRIVDSLACAYAGIDEMPVQRTRDVATRRTGDRAVSIIGGGTSSVESGAFANGVMIRYLDWNDTYLSAEPAHPSDNLGAILAVADAYDCAGADVILATALAYELQCRLCDAASLRAHGFDHVNYGLVSATLASAKLMDATETEMTEAVNIALNAHIALRQARAGELTEWKGMAFGNVDRNAAYAAELATAGLRGPTPIFEGTFGFFNQVSGEFDLDLDRFGGNDGTFKINETLVKFYPVEYHAQAAVNCVMALRAEHGIEASDIESIENETYEAGVSIIADEREKWRPQTRETADHSMPYCIARTFLDGEMTLRQFDVDKYTDPAVLELMDAVSVTENAAFTEQYGESFPHRMVVHTTEGGTFEHAVEYPKGHYENPLSADELQAKFSEGAEGTRSADEQAAMLAAIQDLESATSFASVAQQL